MAMLHDCVLPIEYQIIAPLCLRFNLEVVVLQHSIYADVALVAVAGRLNYSVAFYNISLILRSIAPIFRRLF